MTLSGGFDAYASYASSIDAHSLRRFRALRASGKSSTGARRAPRPSVGKMIGSYAQMRAERAGSPHLAEKECGRALRVTARDQPAVAREAEMLDDRERITREAVPRVGAALGIGRVAVAVAAEVERPHVPARGDEPVGDRRPHRVRESRSDGRAAPAIATIGSSGAQSCTASSPAGPAIV